MSLLSRGGRPSSSYKDSRKTEPPDPGFGWVACTTDDILAHKPEMWDLLVTLPPQEPRRRDGEGRSFPSLTDSKGKVVRATQRDLRRWTTLRRNLTQHIRMAGGRPKSSSAARTTASPSPFTHASSHTLKTTPANKSSRPPTPSTNTFLNAVSDLEPSFEDPVANEPSLGDTPDAVVEPQSWSALAYTSFLWWASAGEKRTDLDEEAAHDTELMADLASTPVRQAMRDYGENEIAVTDEDEVDHDDRQAEAASTKQGWEVGLIKYFHRLSSLMFSTLATIIDSEDEQDDSANDDGSPPSRERYRDEPAEEELEGLAEGAPLLSNASTAGEDVSPVHVGNGDLMTLGLDVYSHADKTFTKEMVALYWGRDASVASGRWMTAGGDGDGWELCGLRVC